LPIAFAVKKYQEIIAIMPIAVAARTTTRLLQIGFAA
jgi:hypothetical protein